MGGDGGGDDGVGDAGGGGGGVGDAGGGGCGVGGGGSVCVCVPLVQSAVSPLFLPASAVTRQTPPREELRARAPVPVLPHHHHHHQKV